MANIRTLNLPRPSRYWPSMRCCLLTIFLWLICPQVCKPQPPSVQDGLFNKQGQVKSDQRFWVLKDGKLILSMTAQELLELEKKARESTAIPVSLSKANLSIEIGEASAKVRANFTTFTEVASSTVRRFDLQLKNCHLVDDPVFRSESGSSGENQLLATDDGYRWHHLSDAAGNFTISLVAKCLVGQVGDRRTLNIDLPSVGTVIDVDLPVGTVEERVRAEDLIDSRTVDEKGVHLKIRTRGGPFLLSWRREKSSQAHLTAVEAKCNTLYEPTDLLDRNQFWSATSTLTVRWYGGGANAKIQLALPEGAQWSQLPYSEPDRFRITTMMPQAAGPESSQELLEIENLDTTDYPSIENLKLQWRWLPKDVRPDRQSTALTLPVPQVSGVDSYDGNVEVVFPNAFQVTYQEGSGMRFIQQGRTANLVGRQQIQFQYKGSAASLQMNFRKEQYQPIVQPIYHVHIREDRLELTGWIKSTFDNSYAELGILPGEWKIEEDLACSLSDNSQPLSNENEPLLVQRQDDGSLVLRPRESNGEEDERQSEQYWRFVAVQSIETNNRDLHFQLPQIDRGRSIGQKIIDHGSGVLLITSENFLPIQPDTSKLQGLMRNSFSNEYSAYLKEQVRQPLAYRFLRQGLTPSWHGHVNLLARHVDNKQLVELDLQPNRILIRQDLDLRIANRSITDLQLLIRDDVTPVRAMVGGATLTFSPVSSPQPASAISGVNWKSYRLDGMPELIGDVQVSLVSSLIWQRPNLPQSSSKDVAIDSIAIEVPLIQLEHPDIRSEGTTFWKATSTLPIEVHTADFSVTLNGPARELLAEKTAIDLTVRNRVEQVSMGVVNKGTWVQTLLNGVERRDRMVSRVSSASKQVTIQLPEQAQLSFQVAIDGRQLSSEAAPYDYSLHRTQILLPDENEHTVELYYTLNEPLSWLTKVEVNPAKIIEATSHEKYYWQLVSPNIFHLGWCPANLTSEWQWKWDVFCWSRVSDFDQAGLERQFGASTLSKLPLGTNSYVMSGFDDFPTIRVWILSRFILWLPVGIISILLSLLVLNIAALRSPTSLVILCVGIMAAAVIWPDLSLLIGQAAVASLGLVALIWITQAAIQTKVRRRSVFSTRPITNTDISDHQRTISRSARSQGSGERPAGVTVE